MKRTKFKPSFLKRTKMKRKGRAKPTVDHQARHDRIREYGCLLCGSPANIHHLRDGLGMGQAVDHSMVIGLCYSHHQGTAAGDISIHGKPAEFIALYGTEKELEARQKMILGEA